MHVEYLNGRVPSTPRHLTHSAQPWKCTKEHKGLSALKTLVQSENPFMYY